MKHRWIGGGLLTLCCAVAVALSTACLADEPAAPSGPAYLRMIDVQTQAARLTNRAFEPQAMRPAKGRILWLSGDPLVWTHGSMQRVLKWVAKGNIAWIDTNLSCAIGPHGQTGGGVAVARTVEAAAGHPLVAGVNAITARDTFAYIRGLPTGATALMTEWNRPNHVVLAVWPIDDGIVVLRPPARPLGSTPHPLDHEHWLDVNSLDGQRMTYNLCLFSLNFLGKAPPAPGE